MLGALQTGSPDPVEFAIANFGGGINVLDPPQQIGEHDLTIALDGYLIATGSGQSGFQMRNGMNSWNSHQTASSALILARFYQDVQNGSVVTPETTMVLGQIGNTLYSIPQGSGAFTSIGDIHGGSVPAGPMTWVRIQNPNDPHFPSGLTDCMVICTGSGGPYVYDGVNLYTPASWSSAASASWCAVVNGILWFGGIPATPNQIWGAGDGITASMETLPPYRNFVLSSPVMGLCAQGTGANASLVVGCNQGLSVLYGTGPSTFYRQDIPFQDGVTAGRTMVANNGIVYFLAHEAVYAFDGVSTPKQVSVKIQPWILNDPYHQTITDFPMTGNTNLFWSQCFNNKMHLGYCSNSLTPNIILCYDLTVGGWTVLRPAAGAASMMLFDAPSDPNPYTALIGTATTAQAMEWDYAQSITSDNVYDDSPTNTVPVLAQCQTKNFALVVPAANKMLTRFYPELFIAGPITVSLTANVDSGNSIAQTLVNSASYAQSGTLVWDVGNWDQATWFGAGFLRFGPPATRTDWNLEFRELALGISNSTAQPVWMWTGGLGSCVLRGLT